MRPETPRTGRPIFVENAGQWSDVARFRTIARSKWLDPRIAAVDVEQGALVFNLLSAMPAPPARFDVVDGVRPESIEGVSFKLVFEGASPDAALEAEDPSSTNVSYLHGDDPARWVKNAPAYSALRVVGLYPGVDLVLAAGKESAWSPRLEGIDRAALERVRIRIEGAESRPGDGGATIVSTAFGDVRIPPIPARDRSNTPVELFDTSVRGAGLPVFSTFFGEPAYINAVAVDRFGFVYVAGAAGAVPATPGAYSETPHPYYYEGFVAKLDPSGSYLIWCTYLGGSGTDIIYGLAVMPDGDPFVAGFTTSADLPITANAYDGITSNDEGFYIRLAWDGSAVAYGTYLGGSDDDAATSIAVDDTGRAVVGGYTKSTNFPATATCDTSIAGTQDGFVSSFQASGAIAWSRYLGGTAVDAVNSVALDPSGYSVAGGLTYSTNFPTTSSGYDLTANGTEDAFITRFSASSCSLNYGTYFGGTSRDRIWSVAATSTFIFAAGDTLGTIPVSAHSFDTSPNGSQDGFAIKIQPTSGGAFYGAYLGGTDWDSARAIAVTSSNVPIVAGITQSAGFRVSSGAFDNNLGGVRDGFVTKLTGTLALGSYSTFLGGTFNGPFPFVPTEQLTAIAVDPTNRAVVAGQTDSSDYPTTPGSYDPTPVFSGNNNQGVITQLD